MTRRTGGYAGRFVVLASPVNTARSLEIAVGLDQAGRILGVLPLTQGPRLALTGTPDLADLHDLPLGQAARLCMDRADAMPLDRPFWLSLASLLGRLHHAGG